MATAIWFSPVTHRPPPRPWARWCAGGIGDDPPLGIALHTEVPRQFRLRLDPQTGIGHVEGQLPETVQMEDDPLPCPVPRCA